MHNQRWPDQAQGEAVDRAGQVGPGHLFGHDRLFHRPRLLAAVLTRPAHTDEASIIQRPLPRLFLGECFQVSRGMFGAPLADTLPKRLVLG